MAARKTLNLSLPPAMKAWIDREVERGQFGTASEYLRHLVRQAQANDSRDAIDEQLLAGLDSPSHRVTPLQRQRLRNEARRQLARTRRKSA